MSDPRVQVPWLRSQLEQLTELSNGFEGSRGQTGADGASLRDCHSPRHQFHEALQRITAEITQRPGVLSCFVANEGLVFAQAGHHTDTEALAAMSQLCMEYGTTAAGKLGLGNPRQMVIVGDQSKFALFPIGRMVLGLVANRRSSLARALSGPGSATAQA